MKALLIAAAAGALLGIGLSGAFSSESAKWERGKGLYSQQCEIYHGVKGDGEFAADFTKAKFWQENGVEEMADVIKNARGPIPGFVDLKPEEIQMVIDYISTFRKDRK